MAKYDASYIIDMNPEFTEEGVKRLKQEAENIANTMSKNASVVFDIDKTTFNADMKSLKRDLDKLAGTRVTTKTDLSSLELDPGVLQKVEKLRDQYADMADFSKKHRISVNSVNYQKAMQKTEELKNVYKEISRLDITNSDDIKEATRLIQVYKDKAQSLARLGWEKNAMTPGMKDELVSASKTRQQTKAMNELKQSVGKTEKEVKDLTKETKEFWRAGDSSGSTVDKINKIKNSYKETEREARNAGRAVKDTNKDLQDTGGANNATKSLDSLAKSFQNVLRYAVIGFAWQAFTGEIKEAVQYIKQLDVVLTEISVVTGKSREQIYELGKEFNNLAAELGRTTNEVAEASKIFFRQGKTTEQVMLLVEASTKAASVAHINLAEASDYLTSTLNGFQMEATEAMDVVDKFSAVGANAGTSFEEMAQALKKVASSANNANVDMDHMISYLATVSEVTREAPENIGTSFKTLFARMQKITDGDMPEELNKVDRALGSIGVSLTDSSGQIKSLQTVIEDLGASWKGLEKNQQAYLATSIAGTRQQVRFISLMDNYDRSLEILDTSLDSAGEGQRQFNAYLEGFEAKLKAAKAEVQKLYMAIKESGVLEYTVEKFTEIVKVLGYFVEGGKSAEVAAIALTAALTALVAKATLVTMSAGYMGAAFSLIAKLSPGVAGSLLLIKKGLVQTIIGAEGLKVAMAPLLPIFLKLAVVAGIVAAGFKISKVLTENAVKFEKIADSTNEAVDALSNFVNKEERVASLMEKHVELSEKIGDSNTAYKDKIELQGELLDLEKELGQLLPETATAWDEQGEAIAVNTEEIKKNIDAKRREKMLEIQKQASGQGLDASILKGATLSYKGLEEEVEAQTQLINQLEENVKNVNSGSKTTSLQLQKAKKELEELVAVQEDFVKSKNAYMSILEGYDLVGKTADEMIEVGEKLGLSQDDLIDWFKTYDESIESMADVEAASMEIIIELIPKKITEKQYLDAVENLISSVKTSPELRRSMNEIGEYTASEMESAISEYLLEKTIGPALVGMMENGLGMEGLKTPEAIKEMIDGIEESMGISIQDLPIEEAKKIILEYMTVVEESLRVTADYSKLNETLTKRINGGVEARATLNKQMEEFNKTGRYSVETLNEILLAYPQLNSEINDHAAIQEFLREQVNTTTEDMKSAYKERLFYSEGYKSKEKEQLRNHIDEMADDLGVDLSNFKDLYSKKIAVMKAFKDEAKIIFDALLKDIGSGDEIVAVTAEKAWMRKAEEVAEQEGIAVDLIDSIELDSDLFNFDSTKKGLEEVKATILDIKRAELAWKESQYNNLEGQERTDEVLQKMKKNIEDRLALEKEIREELEIQKKTAEDVSLYNIKKDIEDSLIKTRELNEELKQLFEIGGDTEREILDAKQSKLEAEYKYLETVNDSNEASQEMLDNLDAQVALEHENLDLLERQAEAADGVDLYNLQTSIIESKNNIEQLIKTFQGLTTPAEEAIEKLIDAENRLLQIKYNYIEAQGTSNEVTEALIDNVEERIELEERNLELLESQVESAKGVELTNLLADIESSKLELLNLAELIKELQESDEEREYNLLGARQDTLGTKYDNLGQNDYSLENAQEMIDNREEMLYLEEQKLESLESQRGVLEGIELENLLQDIAESEQAIENLGSEIDNLEESSREAKLDFIKAQDETNALKYSNLDAEDDIVANYKEMESLLHDRIRAQRTLRAELVKSTEDAEGIELENLLADIERADGDLADLQGTLEGLEGEVRQQRIGGFSAEISRLEAQYNNLDMDDLSMGNARAIASNIQERITLTKQLVAELEIAAATASGIELSNLQTDIVTAEGEIENLTNQLETMYDAKIESARNRRKSEQESQKGLVIEMYNEIYKKRKEIAEEAHEDYMEKNQEKIEALQERYKEEDYLKSLADKRDKQEEIQDRINQYRLIGTEAARKKILELEEEYSEIEEGIEEEKIDRERDSEISALEEIGEKREEIHEESMNLLDEELEEIVNNIKYEFESASSHLGKLRSLTEEYGIAGTTAVKGIFSEIQNVGSEISSITSDIAQLNRLSSQITIPAAEESKGEEVEAEPIDVDETVEGGGDLGSVDGPEGNGHQELEEYKYIDSEGNILKTYGDPSTGKLYETRELENEIGPDSKVLSPNGKVYKYNAGVFDMKEIPDMDESDFEYTPEEPETSGGSEATGEIEGNFGTPLEVEYLSAANGKQVRIGYVIENQDTGKKGLYEDRNAESLVEENTLLKNGPAIYEWNATDRELFIPGMSRVQFTNIKQDYEDVDEAEQKHGLVTRYWYNGGPSKEGYIIGDRIYKDKDGEEKVPLASLTYANGRMISYAGRISDSPTAEGTDPSYIGFDDINPKLKQFADGGISDKTQLAMLHGTKRKPEFIFNYDQMRALDKIMGGGSGITIGNLVNIEGDVSDRNLGEIKGTIQSEMKGLKEALQNKGKNTRVRGSI